LVLEKLDKRPPIVIRLVGTNEEEGHAILAKAGVSTARTMDEAAEKVVAIVRESREGALAR
jgi:succinyl-CoA synthetase beta subunit